MKKCWLGVVSKEHVMRGVNGNYVQVCHGKKSPLQRMKAGDYFVYYSPVVTFGGKDKLQAFTAVGTVISGNVYQFEMSPDFKPYRADVKFVNCKEVKVSALKDQLSILQGNWGMKFRSGHFEVPMADFQIIANAMGVDIANQLTLDTQGIQGQEKKEDKKKPILKQTSEKKTPRAKPDTFFNKNTRVKKKAKEEISNERTNSVGFFTK